MITHLYPWNTWYYSVSSWTVTMVLVPWTVFLLDNLGLFTELVSVSPPPKSVNRALVPRIRAHGLALIVGARLPSIPAAGSRICVLRLVRTAEIYAYHAIYWSRLIRRTCNVTLVCPFRRITVAWIRRGRITRPAAAAAAAERTPTTRSTSTTATRNNRPVHWATRRPYRLPRNW